MKGIKVITTEESYTSKASFLSLDIMTNYGDDGANKVKFSGYRETRGLTIFLVTMCSTFSGSRKIKLYMKENSSP